MQLPTIGEIRAAHSRIRPQVHWTPVLRSSSLDTITGSLLFFKCENFQKVGAFKFRGATNAVMQLGKDAGSKGVVTHSSGNHAAALALAASRAGLPAYIVMPSNAPDVKKQAVQGYGARITFCEPTLKAREETTTTIMQETGATLVHPYDNHDVICGQGTAALELIEEIPGLDIIVAPVGGGGLMSGTLIAARGINPAIRVYGAEPLGADDASRSVRCGTLQPSVNPGTIADGLLTSLSERTFAVISANIDDILTVSEQSIIACMKMVWERMKIIIEPSSATVLAAVMENKQLFAGKRTGLIISGGNVDLLRLPFNQIS
ncbi:MAG: pyridoxal-phosphate dependent enzyme [Bacteroidales bacterium]